MCTAMLQDLLERGLRVDESILCVVDGGKGGSGGSLAGSKTK